ncbi:MAG: CPBP family intramembrane metalloprotease [Cryomorphaceae bacterium]|nr:CPBP family intramembrane metalloprotease [Cryomorphaceae bacterium]
MEWFALTIIVVFSVMSMFVGFRTTSFEKDDFRKNIYYSLIGLCIIYVLVPKAFWFAPHELWAPKSWLFFKRESDLLSVILPIFTVNLILSLTSVTYKSKDLISKKEIMGFPVTMLPDNLKSMRSFAFDIAVAVVFEELVFRLVLFYLLFTTLGMTGWWLIIVSSLIFSLGHSYQGLKGLFGSFIIGIFLAISYIITESIWTPIILHLLNNAALIVYGIKRIRLINEA